MIKNIQLFMDYLIDLGCQIETAQYSTSLKLTISTFSFDCGSLIDFFRTYPDINYSWEMAITTQVGTGLRTRLPYTTSKINLEVRLSDLGFIVNQLGQLGHQDAITINKFFTKKWNFTN